jgi:hypothetical protein
MPVRRADALTAIGCGGMRDWLVPAGVFPQWRPTAGRTGTCHGPLSDLVGTWRVPTSLCDPGPSQGTRDVGIRPCPAWLVMPAAPGGLGSIRPSFGNDPASSLKNTPENRFPLVRGCFTLTDHCDRCGARWPGADVRPGWWGGRWAGHWPGPPERPARLPGWTGVKPLACGEMDPQWVSGADD